MSDCLNGYIKNLKKCLQRWTIEWPCAERIIYLLIYQSFYITDCSNEITTGALISRQFSLYRKLIRSTIASISIFCNRKYYILWLHQFIGCSNNCQYTYSPLYNTINHFSFSTWKRIFPLFNKFSSSLCWKHYLISLPLFFFFIYIGNSFIFFCPPIKKCQWRYGNIVVDVKKAETQSGVSPEVRNGRCTGVFACVPITFAFDMHFWRW